MSDDSFTHLQPIDEAIVEELYARVRALPVPLHVRLELDAFRESRTPWDAMRLANALHHPMLAPALVKELDALVQERGGLKPKAR